MALTSTQGSARPGFAAPVSGRPAFTPTVPGTSGLQQPGGAQPGFANPVSGAARPIAVRYPGSPTPAPVPTSTTTPASGSTPGVPAPAPLPSLSTDPTFLEFARSLGLSQADAQAAASQAQAQVGARLSNTLAQQSTANRQALENQAGGLESRGILNSGQALRDITTTRAAQGFREEALRQQAAQQISQIATNLALQMQAGNQRQAELGLSVAPNVYGTANPVDPMSTAAPLGVM